MARLKDFSSYIDERSALLKKVERDLVGLQEKYETFFSEVTKVRDSEFEQLQSHILSHPNELSPDLTKALAEARSNAERDLDTEIESLGKERDKIARQAEEKRKAALHEEKKVHKKNIRLDREEEKLKTRNENFLAQIAEFNGRIRELGHGFGFFTNLFRMRKLQKIRKRLGREQSDVAAQIDRLRQKWKEFDGEHTARDEKSKADWVELRTEAAAWQTKIKHIEASRQQIIQRSTLEAVLFTRKPNLPKPGPNDPACPRCKQPNPPGCHFCHICAARLTADRPDFSGSIEEIAEINLHHTRFGEGMRACQEIIGLVRGLISGLAAFRSSVVDMIDSENKYPLPKLQINVPQKSLAYGSNFDALASAVSVDHSLHPKEFAERIRARITEVYTEGEIKKYFETMGQELSRQANSQW
ncbi:MAG TPA: hypothetical protein VM425_05590 [Myxococcota bacterium]|nr:hypothetical protein [Myxococcota bacterium]